MQGGQPYTQMDQAQQPHQGHPPPYLQGYRPGQQQQQQPQPQRAQPYDPSEGRMVFRVGTLCFGIPLHVHVLMAVLPVLQLLSTLLAYRGYDVLGLAMLNSALLYVLLLPLTVLVHEMGHCTAAKAVGASVTKILLWPLGGLAYIGSAELRAHEFAIAICGPLTHLPLFLALYLLSLADKPTVLTSPCGSFETTDKLLSCLYEDHFLSNFCRDAQWMQVVLMAFNLLLPAFPLDGGRILVIVLTNWCSAVTTAWVSIIATCTICCAAAGYTVIMYFLGNGFQLMWVVIALWLMLNSYQLHQSIKSGVVELHPLFNRRDA